MDKTEEAKTQPAEQAPYEPTPEEQASLDAFAAERKRRRPAPSLKADGKGENLNVSWDHPDAKTADTLLMAALGTTDRDFYDGFVRHLLSASCGHGSADLIDLNFMLSVVKGIEPRDQVEAMLAAQMAAIHAAMMTFAHRLAHVDNIAQQDSAERAFNKLARTFAAQMETLKRYRSTGEQRMTVEHVTVNAGGQAIVGAVSTGGAGIEKVEGQPHARAIAHAPGEVLPSNIQAIRETVPIASR